MVNSYKKNPTEETTNIAFGSGLKFDGTKDLINNFTISSDPKPRDFFSFYMHQHRLDPGPKYDVELNMTKKSPTRDNPPRVKIMNTKIPTNIQIIEAQAKKTPASNFYKPHRDPKILGTILVKEKIGAFSDQAIFYGKETPGHYPSVDPYKYKMSRTAEWKVHKPINSNP
jgi:hypothetical protein